MAASTFASLGQSAPQPNPAAQSSGMKASPSSQAPPITNPESPVNPYEINDPRAVKKIKTRIEGRFKKANNRRFTFELPWLRNVLYYCGIQWIRADYTTKSIQNLKMPAGFPRAITNTYAKVNGDLMSSITQGDIPLNPVPKTDNADDIATSEVAERIREVIDDEVEVRSKKRDLGFWLTLTGNGFLDSYYDYNEKYGTRLVPQFSCTNCGALTFDNTQPCQKCGGAPPPPEPPIDATGVPVPVPPPPPPFQPAAAANLPIGKLCVDTLSPFEVYWDNTMRLGTGKHTWYLRPHKYDVDDAKANWSAFATKITDSMTEPMRVTRNYLIAIAYAGSYLTAASGTGDISADGKKQLTAWVYQEMPCPDYPEGVRAVQMGDEILELGPLPSEYGAGQSKGQKFLPLDHFYMENSGGAWGKPRANDLCGIQARRNIVASNLQLTIQRTGSPKLMNPVGSGIKNVTGEAGQMLNYKPLTFGGTSVAEPHYLEAALGNLQPIQMHIDKLDGEMESIAGTHFVTGADVPAGVTAASALSFLGEKANQAIAPIKEIWVEGWRGFYIKAIEFARQHWTDERTLSVLGENKQWQFIKFKSADLKGAINYDIDYDAMFPKSQATERANIMALVQMAAINPQDPEQAYAIIKAFGETKLKASVDRAKQQAMREWDAFLNEQKPPVLKPLVQDAAIHLLQHKYDAQSQEYEQLPPETQSIWDAHIQATATELMVASMPMGPGGPTPLTAPGEHAGSKVAGSQAGSQQGPAQANLAPHGEPAAIRKGQEAASPPAMG